MNIYLSFKIMYCMIISRLSQKDAIYLEFIRYHQTYINNCLNDDCNVQTTYSHVRIKAFTP
jgi:hypothetical protein